MTVINWGANTAVRNLETALAHVIVASPGRLPSDLLILTTAAALEFCPHVGVSRRARADYLAVLIDSALVEAGV